MDYIKDMSAAYLKKVDKLKIRITVEEYKKLAKAYYDPSNRMAEVSKEMLELIEKESPNLPVIIFRWHKSGFLSILGSKKLDKEELMTTVFKYNDIVNHYETKETFFIEQLDKLESKITVKDKLIYNLKKKVIIQSGIMFILMVIIFLLINVAIH